MMQGYLQKLKATLPGGTDDPEAHYHLQLGDTTIALNDLLGKTITLENLGTIRCIHCGRVTKKSFQYGYCFPCVRSLPETDLCQMRPEDCHHHQGTCRDPEWGHAHCFTPHTIYLANSSAFKVGITRQTPSQRWLAQGATQGLAWLQVANRRDAGLIEFQLRQKVNDKTNWRTMLKGPAPKIDLIARAAELVGLIPASVPHTKLPPQVVTLKYPVARYPEKVKPHNFDKDAVLSGELTGVKGQYLLFGDQVVNIRKYSGYQMSCTIH